MKTTINTIETIATWTLALATIPVAIYTACIGEYAACAMCVMLSPLVVCLAIYPKVK